MKRIREFINKHPLVSVLMSPVLALSIFIVFVYARAGIYKIYDLATIGENAAIESLNSSGLQPVVAPKETINKNYEFLTGEKVSWTGTVVALGTYGRLRIKSSDLEQYGYSEFIAEPDDVDDTPTRASKTTENIKEGDLVQITGYWEEDFNGIPWVRIEKIEKYKK